VHDTQHIGASSASTLTSRLEHDPKGGNRLFRIRAAEKFASQLIEIPKRFHPPRADCWLLRRSADDIVRRQEPPNPLQLELTDRLDFHGILHFHQHSGTDENLPGLGLIAKSYLTPTVLTDVPARLGELSATLRAQAWSIFTTKGLEQEFRSLGVGGVEAADAVIGDEDGLLRLAAAKHINANKVKSAKRKIMV
jgi:hypothetical protein